MITLRPYQELTLELIWSYFASGKTGNPLIAYPTGTGKSAIPAVFIQRIMKVFPEQRFLMVTHVKELIEQNYEVLRCAWPEAPVGIYSAGLKRRDIAHPIIYGGIQSMIKNPAIFGHRDIIFIDEAHLVSQEDNSMYLTFLATLKLLNPKLKVIGLTATPFRMGQGYLTDDGLFTDIIHDLTDLENFNRLIAEGYMSPLIPKRTHTELDVSSVGIQKGEFIGSQLEKAVDIAGITHNALRETCEAGANRKSWLIFASGIEHANHIADTLSSFGIDCASVHSKQKSHYNDAAIKAFKDNRLRAIVNFGKLTTGFNHPAIDLICDLRPTMSIPLHIQKLGRGTRPANGKQNCILKGTLILTDCGLVPIEYVTVHMKLWDGIEFVSHDGVIYKGIKKVIKYAGLQATPDHRVNTNQGWKTLQLCKSAKIPIRVTGIGGKTIWKTENYFTRTKLSNTKTPTHINRMSSLFKTKLERLLECANIKSWLPSVWQQSCMAAPSKMVTISLYYGKGSLYKQEQQTIFGLWWSRNTISLFQSNSDGNLDNEQFRFTQRIRNRQNKQRWKLRDWKYKIFNQVRKYGKSSTLQSKRQTDSISYGHVYDILNVGPRNRFTANGLLVHNCLVLDFGRNVPRLGPINDPFIPKKKGEGNGDVPVKICDNCGVYNHAKVRFCVNCGHEFQFQIKIVPKSGTDLILRDETPQIEMFDVDRVIYNRFNSKNGKAPYIRATYTCGLRAFNEFVFPEGSGYSKHLFHNWWKQRHITEPPANSDVALQYIAQLREPKRIRVWVNKKHPEVVGVEF